MKTNEYLKRQANNVISFKTCLILELLLLWDGINLASCLRAPPIRKLQEEGKTKKTFITKQVTIFHSPFFLFYRPEG